MSDERHVWTTVNRHFLHLGATQYGLAYKNQDATYLPDLFNHAFGTNKTRYRILDQYRSVGLQGREQKMWKEEIIRSSYNARQQIDRDNARVLLRDSAKALKIPLDPIDQAAENALANAVYRTQDDQEGVSAAPVTTSATVASNVADPSVQTVPATPSPGPTSSTAATGTAPSRSTATHCSKPAARRGRSDSHAASTISSQPKRKAAAMKLTKHDADNDVVVIDDDAESRPPVKKRRRGRKAKESSIDGEAPRAGVNIGIMISRTPEQLNAARTIGEINEGGVQYTLWRMGTCPLTGQIDCIKTVRFRTDPPTEREFILKPDCKVPTFLSQQDHDDCRKIITDEVWRRHVEETKQKTLAQAAMEDENVGDDEVIYELTPAQKAYAKSYTEQVARLRAQGYVFEVEES